MRGQGTRVIPTITFIFECFSLIFNFLNFNFYFFAIFSATHSKSTAQVMLRWNVQRNVSVVSKSTKIERIAENFDIFDFELSAEEVRIFFLPFFSLVLLLFLFLFLFNSFSYQFKICSY